MGSSFLKSSQKDPKAMKRPEEKPKSILKQRDPPPPSPSIPASRRVEVQEESSAAAAHEKRRISFDIEMDMGGPKQMDAEEMRRVMAEERERDRAMMLGKVRN